MKNQGTIDLKKVWFSFKDMRNPLIETHQSELPFVPMIFGTEQSPFKGIDREIFPKDLLQSFFPFAKGIRFNAAAVPAFGIRPL